MTTAFVLGNGISRQAVSLPALKQHGSIYGCNALHREFVPDVLVATDLPISTHIQQSGYSKNNKFYTRRPQENTGALKVPSQYHGFSSGPIAVGIAAIDGHQRIYLLGFDLGPDQNQKFNNVYAGTEFYKPANSSPTFTGNWIKQLIKIAKDYPQVQFFRVTGPTSAQIKELHVLPNMQHVDINTLLDRINNKKDL
jgi:hypothetical protein